MIIIRYLFTIKAYKTRMTERFLGVRSISTWTLFLGFVCIINVASTNVNYTNINSNEACTEEGWVGPHCRYRCRCLRACEETTGECVANDLCSHYHFGDGCQYEDLTKEVNQTETILTDSDDTTCIDVDRASILMLARRLGAFRIVTKDEGSFDKISYKIMIGDEYVSCSNKTYVVQIDPKTRDYFCFSESSVTEIVIVGAGVPSLCSVYVYGGRNLALRQEVYTSADLMPDLKGAGVDGVYPLDETMMNTSSCYFANESEETSYYQVRLHVPMIVQYFIIWNRPESELRVNLNNYTLYSYGENNVTLMTYEDTLNSWALVHRVENAYPGVPVSMFMLEKSKTTSPHPLMFCELMAIGDCRPGYHGLDCSERCSSNCNETFCYLHGRCISCVPTFYGPKCDQKCSEHCAGKGLCEQHTGNCMSGCKDGYLTPQCNKECDQGFFGSACTMRCVEGCKHCSKIDGKCHECNIGKFGKYCSSDCSPNCAGNGSCSLSTGICTKGCKHDTVCGPPAECEPGYFGSDCSMKCPESCKLCSQREGHCHECNIGKFGKFCSSDCSTNCAGDGACELSSGICIKGCKTGIFCKQHSKSLKDAGFICSPKCGGNGDCNEENMFCYYGCKAGFHGDTCVNIVDDDEIYLKDHFHQRGNCLKNGTCAVCEHGKYGFYCSMACSKNCGGKQTCHPETGKCSEGCILGFGGFNCSTECSGCYGQVCDMETLICTRASIAEDEKGQYSTVFIIVILSSFLLLGP